MYVVPREKHGVISLLIQVVLTQLFVSMRFDEILYFYQFA